MELLKLKTKHVGVTGGAGSIGSALVKKLVCLVNIENISVFDISEKGLFQLEAELNPYDSNVNYILGDMRVRDSVESLKQCDVIIHAGALKHLYFGNVSPHEVYLTNVEGTRNLVLGTLNSNVEQFIFISSDKSVYATCVYGASKLIGEQLVLNANRGGKNPRYSVIRLGNVKETSGNVFEIWKRQKMQGKPLTVTHPDMKRYYMGLNEAVLFIMNQIGEIGAGEIRIPRMKEYKIIDLAKEVDDNIIVTKPHLGEKLVEDLVTKREESKMTEHDWGWIIK